MTEITIEQHNKKGAVSVIKILDNSSQRLISILSLLLETEEGIKISEIASNLNVSEKTIHDDLKIISESWANVIGLNLSLNGTIKVSKLSVSTFLQVRSSILLQSIPMKFLKSLVYHPNEDLNFYADKLHISRSTLYRYIPIINNYLTEYDITIDNSHSVYALISSNEVALRCFVTTFFLEISGYTLEDFMTQDEIKFLRTRIIRSYEKNLQHISDLQLDFYTVLYFVSIKRELQGFTADYSQFLTGETDKLNEQEEKYLSKIYPHASIESIMKIEQIILILRSQLNRDQDEHLLETIPFFLNSILNILNIKASTHEYKLLLNYLKDLYLNEKYIQIPFYLVGNQFIFFTKEAEKDNSSIINQLRDWVDELTIVTNTNFNHYFDYIVYIFITNFPEMMQIKIKKNVLVISNQSKEHAEFLLKTIRTKLNTGPIYLTNIECTSLEQIQSINLDKYQFIIKNFALPKIDCESILINDFPSDKNIQTIKSLLFE